MLFPVQFRQLLTVFDYLCVSLCRSVCQTELQSSSISLLFCGGSAYVITPSLSVLPLAFLVCGPT